MIKIHIRTKGERSNTLFNFQHTWEIGKQGTMGLLRDLPDVYCVVVDGFELTWILEQRTVGLPRLISTKYNDREPHTWFGDHAKFIVANICLREMECTQLPP